jgi:hypothetical protein
MRSMFSHSKAAIERAMAKKIIWWQAVNSSASVIGSCSGAGALRRIWATMGCRTGGGTSLARWVPLATVKRVLVS